MLYISTRGGAQPQRFTDILLEAWPPTAACSCPSPTRA